jgi:hypothetical protein
VLLSLMLAASAGCRAEAARTWHFTGLELIAALEGKMPSQVRDASLGSLFSSSYGQAYILGIADQTQGKLWCTRTGVLPHELGDRVYSYLSTLPPARLDENAGPLVGEALQRSFSCRGGEPRR